MIIDTTFDFTCDSPGYWDRFWENGSGTGKGSCDPDSVSRTLRDYHQYLWSKELPNGQAMKLDVGWNATYLTWKDFRFGSDSIIVSFRYRKMKELLDSVSKAVPDYKAFVENYIHRSYTIGGTIIFPKHRNSINQCKGTNPLIADRWDLTLECIRRYYKGENSPLYDVLLTDKRFFDLFVDFKGYVDFFLLQDCVSSDYSKVDIWLGDGEFDENPLPKTTDQYLWWIDKEMMFLEKRNLRIKEYTLKNKDSEGQLR